MTMPNFFFFGGGGGDNKVIMVFFKVVNSIVTVMNLFPRTAFLPEGFKIAIIFGD